jgi:hypothetical protein|nr:MAG TPA: hypothetical protein [Caudoviricetes sp.]DAU85251.1 MAG TPA: hypothetical protein [Caudoviricetes sp.]
MPIYLLSPRTILVVEVTIKLKNMMDDKKIEEVAKVYMIGEFYDRDEAEWNYPITNEEKRNQCIIDFKAGAKWAINEFLKNLWHPASEAPKRRCNYLLLHYKDKEEECFEADVVDTKAWDCYIKGSLVEYINIDDLFPKGGEQ